MPPTFRGQILSFRQSTRDRFWDHIQPGSQQGQTPNGIELFFRCVSCGNWYTYDAIQMGHIVDWAAYLVQRGITETAGSTWDQAQDAYNDLDNVGPQCRTCNQSHDWEGNSDDDDGDMDDADEQGNLAGFVTPPCPACNSEDTIVRDNDMGQEEYMCRRCFHTWPV